MPSCGAAGRCPVEGNAASRPGRAGRRTHPGPRATSPGTPAPGCSRLGGADRVDLGVTIAIDDVVTPPEKAAILDKHEKEADKIEKQYQRGVITDDERRQELIEIWTDATSRLGAAMEANFSKTNPIYMMVHSGARGNMVQMRQIAAINRRLNENQED